MTAPTTHNTFRRSHPIQALASAAKWLRKDALDRFENFGVPVTLSVSRNISGTFDLLETSRNGGRYLMTCATYDEAVAGLVKRLLEGTAEGDCVHVETRCSR